MDALKPKRITKTEYLTYALPLVCAGYFVALGALGTLTAPDLAISLAGILLPAGAAILLRRLGMGRYAFIPALVFAAVTAYAVSALMARDTFTWQSETNALLQVFGLFWAIALFLFLYALIGRLTPAMITGGVITLVFGLANTVMTQFRGRLFLVGDVTALQTAVNVAGHYSIRISAVFILAVLLELSGCLAAILLGRAESPRPSRRWRIAARLAALVPAVLYAVWIGGGSVMDACGIRLTWNQNDFEESPVLYFVESIRELNVAEPDGYSAGALDAIAAGIDNPAADTGTTPNVIVIMDEAFSDLRQIGDFGTSAEITPFIDSLKENTVRGYVYSSVFGGSTANSEFEFLTGCSMAFIPNGVSPYQQYIKYNKDTLVSVLESQGYTTAALHPYDASGWNREAVYSCFGFDSVHFINDFKNKKYLRGYVTDASDFENLIGYYEENVDSGPMFIFNITMQNHGSYKTESYASTVSVTGHAGEFPQAEQYLSLLRETDKAVEGLIDYFSGRSEPVVILFFGDHQPALEDGFYDMLYGKSSDALTLEEQQRKQLTPFFIWANYDIPEADIGKTSINYLSPILLQTAGLRSSGFEAFLLDLQKKWPAINAHGCVDASGGHLALDSTEAVSDAGLQNYRMLQYNYLFDTDGYRKDLFTLGSGS
jgi:phosphoglycerol transferase MdoB-like AlkP superfamily enzyme